MPIMPRTDKKAVKIVFNILGTPSNMRKDKRNKKNSEPQSVKSDVGYEETLRIGNNRY